MKLDLGLEEFVAKYVEPSCKSLFDKVYRGGDLTPNEIQILNACAPNWKRVYGADRLFDNLTNS